MSNRDRKENMRQKGDAPFTGFAFIYVSDDDGGVLGSLPQSVSTETETPWKHVLNGFKTDLPAQEGIYGEMSKRGKRECGQNQDTASFRFALSPCSVLAESRFKQ